MLLAREGAGQRGSRGGLCCEVRARPGRSVRGVGVVVSDRRLWLQEPCPTCGVQPGLRCQTSRYRAKPARWLCDARGWRYRPCPTCKAPSGESCHTPTGRQAARPHAARLRGRRELHAEGVWQELERWGAAAALVRFSGGGGRAGTVGAVTLESDERRELARWGDGEGELPEALAAPLWGRYALFAGHPRISGLLMWDVRSREVAVAGKRGGKDYGEVLIPRPRSRVTLAPHGDVSRELSPPALVVVAPERSCEQCGAPIAPSARLEAMFCSKRCRQAASRARLRERSGRAALSAPERCAWCTGSMPAGVRPEARYCSKRCRQAASRARLANQPGRTRPDRPRDSSRNDALHR